MATGGGRGRGSKVDQVSDGDVVVWGGARFGDSSFGAIHKPKLGGDFNGGVRLHCSCGPGVGWRCRRCGGRFHFGGFWG